MPVSDLDMMLIHQHSFLVYNEEAVKCHPNGSVGVFQDREEYEIRGGTRTAA